MPQVSIVMAAYNHGAFISMAIESALAQTLGDIEILIVDDGSTDSTPEVVSPYLADPRVRYFRQNNQGQASAKNFGISQASGEFVAFLDADDIWMPRKLERQIPLFADTMVGVVHCLREIIDPQGCKRPYRPRSLPRGDVINEMFIDNFVCFSSSIVRRACFKELGVFDERLRLGIDYELWLRLASRYAFDHIDEPLVSYRTGHGQLSNSGEERLQTALKIMDQCLCNSSIRPKLRTDVIREAYAMTHNSIAIMHLDSGKLLKTWLNVYTSLRYKPTYFDTYKTVIKSVTPQWALRLRRCINPDPTNS